MTPRQTPLREKRTISAHMNDAAFHLKHAERALEQVQVSFEGRARREIQYHVGTVRKLRRRVMKAIDDAGLNQRGRGLGG